MSLINSRTEEMASKLRKAFKDRKVKKTYLVIAKGIPSLKEGTCRLFNISTICSSMMAVFRRSNVLSNICQCYQSE